MLITSDALVTHGACKAYSCDCGMYVGQKPLALGGFDVRAYDTSCVASMHLTDASLEIKRHGLIRGIYVQQCGGNLGMGFGAAGRNVFFSDDFSGCDFTVYRAADGRYAAAHVYSNDDARAAADRLPPGWRRLGTWESRGYAEAWETRAVHCFALIEGQELVFVAFSLQFHQAISQVRVVARFPI